MGNGIKAARASRMGRFGLCGRCVGIGAEVSIAIHSIVRRRLHGMHGPVAQRLEQGTHNPLVRGSNPCGPTKKKLSVASCQLRAKARTSCRLRARRRQRKSSQVKIHKPKAKDKSKANARMKSLLRSYRSRTRELNPLSKKNQSAVTTRAVQDFLPTRR